MTEEEKDEQWLKEFYEREDAMCSVTYTTRRAALYALDRRWNYDPVTGPYAVEQRDDGLFYIVPDADGNVRAAYKALLADKRLNKLFGQKGEPRGPRGPSGRSIAKAFHVRAETRPKGAPDCTRGPHNNWGKS